VTEDELPPEGIELVDPTWDAWQPREVAERLAGVATPWYVAAGWALDLFRGGPTREHNDLEIGVPTAGFDAVRAALAGYEFHVVGAGRRWSLDSSAFALMHQTWVREPVTGVYRVDVFREPHEGRTWICRRDETVRARMARVTSRCWAPSCARRQIRRVLASQAGRSIRSPTGRPKAAAWVSWTMTPRYRAGCRSSRIHPSPNASRITASLI
jgi:hypothetical protein